MIMSLNSIVMYYYIRWWPHFKVNSLLNDLYFGLHVGLHFGLIYVDIFAGIHLTDPPEIDPESRANLEALLEAGKY